MGDNKDKQQGLNELFFNIINNRLNNSSNFHNRKEPSLIERNEEFYIVNKTSVIDRYLERQINPHTNLPNGTPPNMGMMTHLPSPPSSTLFGSNLIYITILI